MLPNFKNELTQCLPKVVYQSGMSDCHSMKVGIAIGKLSRCALNGKCNKNDAPTLGEIWTNFVKTSVHLVAEVESDNKTDIDKSIATIKQLNFDDPSVLNT